jgi:hypothetical protein
MLALLACSVPESGTGPTTSDASNDVSVPFDAPAIDTSLEGSAGDAATDAAEEPPEIHAGFALQFSGGSYVEIGTLPIPTDFTIEAWVNPTSTSNETYIVAEDKNGQGDGQFRFGLTNGKLFFLMSDSTGSTHGLYGGGYALETTQSVMTSVCTHVAVVKSGAMFMLVVNGVAAATATATASFAYGGPAVAFRIAARVGSNGTSADGAFDGALDEVRIWNQPRTASAIASTMSTTVPPASPGLEAYWRFDEGMGTTTADEEGIYTGTLVASPAWIVSTAF